MAKQSKNRVKLEQQYRKIGIIHGVNGTGLGEIKGGCQQRPQSRLPDLSVNHPTHINARCEGFGKWTLQIYHKNLFSQQFH